ncbi:GATOR2 complex protein WDR24-like isoform X3 [Bolinopsis microptera]|uniref:GATOR2 complex protein WDR24-like isoform X3 n=1 Tax=Bolinopsis microptera TaxID=2820187 RepID=UPI00307ABC9E
MEKSLRFWNEEKIQKNIFNDSQSGNMIKLAVWTGSKSTTEIRACVIKRHIYKILTIKDKEGVSDNNKSYQFKLPDGEDAIFPTQTVDWNPEHIDQIAVGLANNYVLHWNLTTAKCIRFHKATCENKSSGHSFTSSRTLTCIQWSPKNPNLLIYGTKDPFINVWDVREPAPDQTYANDGVLDIKFDPHDENQFAVASENHDVTIYDLRNTSTEKIRSEKKPVSKKFKFSAHENRTLKCEWNPKIRNQLATSGQTNIKIWAVDYSKEYHLHNEMTLITTRNSAYSIKWSPVCEYLLASHSHSSRYVEIWDIRRRFKPYRHFREDPTNKSKLGRLLLHWHESPHALLTLNTNNADLSMHARRDAINMENFAPSCAISCSPYDEMSFVTAYKPSKRHRKGGLSSEQPSVSFSPVTASYVSEEYSSGNESHEQITAIPDTAPDRSFIFTRPISSKEDYSFKFRYLAKNYKFSGLSLEELCHHNAKIAESQALLHVASNWRLLSVLFASEEVTMPFYEEENQKRNKRSGTVYSDRGTILTSESPESAEQESDSDHMEYPRPSYVSEEELSDEEYNIEPPVDSYQNWDMLDEPFTQQAALNTESTECEELSDRSSQPDPDQGLYSFDNFHQDTMASVRHSRTELMKINMGALTRDMLEDLVNEGDVQTACTMLLVLEKKLTKTIDPMSLGDLEINWFHSYIDLLSRFQLWSVQAAVVAQAPDPIKVLNTKNVITAMCTKCSTNDKVGGKRAVLHSGLCSRCGIVAVCSLCRIAVKGLYIWCQGCCHGGHPHHMRQWFENNRLCPAACGHACQFS